MNEAFPSMATGRPKWTIPSRVPGPDDHPALPLLSDEFEAMLQKQDLLKIKCWGLEKRRGAWKKAHSLIATVLASSKTENPSDWHAMFRRIMVWLEETRE